MKETQHRINQEKQQKHSESILNNNARTMNRDELLLEMNEKYYQQNEEIQQLELMLNAALTVKFVYRLDGLKVAFGY